MAKTFGADLLSRWATATRDSVASGTLELLSASAQVLASFTLTSGGGTIGAATWTLALTSTTTTGLAAAGAGTTATNARLKNTSAAVQFAGMTIGLNGSGADIQMDNVSISTGQNVIISSATIALSGSPT